MSGWKTAVKKLIRALPGKRYILLESYPDLCDNTRPVFDELLRRGYGEKYRFVWWVKDSRADLPAFPNTRYIDTRTRWNRLRMRWYNLRSRCLICCNQFLRPELPGIPSVYLNHGTPVKALPGYHLPEDITYVLVSTENVRGFMAEALHGDIDVFHAVGYPRNDQLTAPKRDLHGCLEGDWKKVVVWYPTFRQHKNGLKTESSHALPVIHDGEKAARLNDLAGKLGILVVLKPHFAQDVSYIKDLGLSNIRFISDEFFTEHGITSYEFVGGCDALLTDYSSIYFDWLLCGGPVGLVWEDIEEYRKNPGFAIDLDHYMDGADKIYTLEELERFLENVAAGIDPGAARRAAISAEVNGPGDGTSTARVTDFIVEKCGL